MGIFAGRLQYTVYKGTNLFGQELIAKTDEDPWLTSMRPA